jgi:hypothetical protein
VQALTASVGRPSTTCRRSRLRSAGHPQRAGARGFGRQAIHNVQALAAAVGRPSTTCRRSRLRSAGHPQRAGARGCGWQAIHNVQALARRRWQAERRVQELAAAVGTLPSGPSLLTLTSAPRWAISNKRIERPLARHLRFALHSFRAAASGRRHRSTPLSPPAIPESHERQTTASRLS